MAKTIYDIGMHAGRDTAFYLKKGFKVVAVEAAPKHVENAKAIFKDEIADGRLVIIDKAIAPEGTEEIEFYTNEENDDWGTILPDWNRGMSNDFKAIKVKAVQLQSIISSHGMPYYMKIDIEGADTLCLRSLLKMNAAPELLSIELPTPSNRKGNAIDCMEILCLLYNLGYRKFKVSGQSRLKYVKCPNPALEGQYVNQDFSGGATSGPFGKELGGPFLTIDEISRSYLDYFYGSSRLNFHLVRKAFEKIGVIIKPWGTFYSGGWFDVHAYL